jgi:hypothetical protein
MQRKIIATGLLIGAGCGQAGGFVGPGPAQDALWAMSSVGLVHACVLLALTYLRAGKDAIAAGPATAAVV